MSFKILDLSQAFPLCQRFWKKAGAQQLSLHKNHIHEKFQPGFRPHHSTETALVKTVNNLLLFSVHGNLSLLVLLDLSAAFDMTDHCILRGRLENLVGVTGIIFWFRSYLIDCSQFVNINGQSSVCTKVMYGVPQGSVLGPLLFTLYMLSLGTVISKHDRNFNCCTDDTQLYIYRPKQMIYFS